MTVKERLKEVINMLRLTNAEFERKVGVGNGYVNNTRVSLGQSVIERIMATFPQVNMEYILLGEGVPLNCEGSELVETVPDDGGVAEGVPYIDSVPSYDSSFRFDIAIRKKKYPRYMTPGMEECDFILKFRGRSMMSKCWQKSGIYDGDYVGCKRWTGSYFRWGEIYVLATVGGFVTVVIQPSELKNHVRCEPINSDEGFRAYDLPMRGIFDMAIVKTVVGVRRLA